MKKHDSWREKIVALSRGKKELKRRRHGGDYKGDDSVYHRIHAFQVAIDKRILEAFKSNFCRLLESFNFAPQADGDIDTRIKIPKVFSLSENYSDTVSCIRHAVACILANRGTSVVYDFSKCKKADQAALFLLQIFRMEIGDELKKLDLKLTVLPATLQPQTIKSADTAVNRHLVLCGFLATKALGKTDGMQPLHTIGYIKGSRAQKHYLENQKGIITTHVRQYVNECLGHHGLEMMPQGINALDGMVSEILNNAEDHSPTNTYYVTANFSRERPLSGSADAEAVGMLNLSILNIGYSIANGFEETKAENADTYAQMDAAFNRVKSLPGCTFTKENLFTLYALQEGISRLRYEDESRGTGTIKFINSFFSIGDYEDEGKDYKPYLSIYSGGTLLICDKKFQPFNKDGRFLISLNEEQDLGKLPCKKHLRMLPTPFPGTLLSASFYLNQEHLTKKLDTNATANEK